MEMELQTEKARFEAISRANGSKWLATVAFLMLFFGGGLFFYDIELDEPMVADRIFYLLGAVVCIGAMLWTFSRGTATVILSACPSLDRLLLVVEGWRACKTEIIPSTVQFWCWYKMQGSTVLSIEAYVQVQTIDGKTIGFLGTFSNDRSIPKDWEKRKPGVPKGVRTYKMPDMVLLLDYIRSYAPQP